MIILNKDNYFTDESRALTNSKLGDYLRCKDYFKRKHIDHTVNFKRTAAMITGSVVDDLLTQDYITENYIVGDKRLKAFKNREDVTVITQTAYDEMMGLAIAVEESSAFRDLKDYQRQVIFQKEWDLGPYFDSIAGIPDFFKIDGEKCIIVDLKTSTTIDPWMYTKHADDMGYYRQQAFYQILIHIAHPEVKKFESRHLVVDKQKDIYNVGTFILDQDKIEFEKEQIFDLFEEISKERDFKKRDATWADAVKI